VECLEGNKYETTIFTLASAVTKLSRVTSVPQNRRLWRGLGGMILPEQFWRNFPECFVTLHVTAESVANKEQNEALQARQEAEAREAVRSLVKTSLSKLHGLSVEVLQLPLADGTTRPQPAAQLLISSWPRPASHQSPDILEVKVVSSNLLDKEGRITLALPISKFDFAPPLQAALCKAVAKACKPRLGTRTIQVEIEDVADKPGDFRGGGSLLHLLNDLFVWQLNFTVSR
jgi:hypothetical protein